MPEDLFAPVPEFLTAFGNILENGFFEEVQFAARGRLMEGGIHSCSIDISGCVPNDPKYTTDGCGVLIDPSDVIASARRLAEQNKVLNISTKVETKDWELWDAAGENVIGSKGTRTELRLLITFKT